MRFRGIRIIRPMMLVGLLVCSIKPSVESINFAYARPASVVPDSPSIRHIDTEVSLDETRGWSTRITLSAGRRRSHSDDTSITISCPGLLARVAGREYMENQEHSIVSLAVEPATKRLDVYLIVLLQGGDLLIVRDFSTRVSRALLDHGKNINLGMLQVREIEGQIITVESFMEMQPRKTDEWDTGHTFKLKVSDEGQFLLVPDSFR